MVKQMMVVPEEVRRSETIQLGSIAVNSYHRTLGEEISDGRLTAANALRIYRDMATIREFESMLDQIKKTGSYQGIAYDHKGPAHLSIGQEAAAVGQSFLLGVDDHVLGSHRSHGEFLAKGLSCIEKLDDRTLDTVMKGYLDGNTLRAIERDPSSTTEETAVDFLL